MSAKCLHFKNKRENEKRHQTWCLFIEFFSNAQKNETDCPNSLKYNLGIGLIARMVKKGNMGINGKYLQGIW